jgi:hypothetical protein
MGKQIRLDEVGIFGEKLHFLIPHEWVEGEDESDTYLYHAPETDSGWLRVSLITTRTHEPEQQLQCLFSDSDTIFTSAKQGNVVKQSEKSSVQEGTQIYIYNWQVANVVLPNRIFQAVFSYTILAERREEKETQETVELLGKLVSEAIFSNGLQ